VQLALSLEQNGVRALLSPDASQNGTRARRAFAPGSSAGRMWLDAMELCGELCARSAVQSARLERAVAAFPSPVAVSGEVEDDSRYRAWRGFDLTRALREHLGVREAGAMSNVEARARFETRFGALQGLDSWLFVDIGERIESWARVNGSDIRGSHVGAVIIERDGASDEWGRRGSLQAYCSEDALRSRAQSSGLGGESPVRLFQLAGASFAAKSLCDDFCARLAQGLSNSVASLGPLPVCLSGPLVREAWPLVWPSLEAQCRASWPPRVVLSVFPAKGGEEDVLWGALANAKIGNRNAEES